MTAPSTDLVGPVPRRRVTTLDVLAAHREEAVTTQHRADASWWLVCECGDVRPAPSDVPWRHTYREHLAEALAAAADDVMHDLARRTWPEDPSPMEDAAHTAGMLLAADEAIRGGAVEVAERVRFIATGEVPR